jgi:uncharacterized protein (TIGR02453 family)
MLLPDFLQYLYDLSQNNNKDWFEKNKKRYEASVKKPFESIVGEIIVHLKVLEPTFQIQPKDCIHRIYRDTRFSTDKTPYKTHASAILTKGGRKGMDFPGYYLHLEFGKLMIGGGAYFLDKEPLRKVRTAIAQDPEAFRSVFFEKEFLEKFGEIKGERNKVLPPEFKEAAQKEALIANKQFYYMAELPPELCLGANFPDLVLEYMRAGRRVNEYLRGVI